MNIEAFLIWLAGGGLVTLATCVCLGLLKLSQDQEDAEDEGLWELLLCPGGPLVMFGKDGKVFWQHHRAR